MSNFIVGADEVGYGSWAGPLVVCGVKAPKDWMMPGLNDSKELSAKEREALVPLLVKDDKIEYHLVEKSNLEIDERKLGVCLKEAYIEIMEKLLTSNAEGIIDGTVKLPKFGSQVTCLIKADQKIPAVMAASIIAKVYRDDLMHKLHFQAPDYNWISNVGYGTKAHKEAIKKHGLSSFHRHSYNIKL